MGKRRNEKSNCRKHFPHLQKQNDGLNNTLLLAQEKTELLKCPKESYLWSISKTPSHSSAGGVFL